MPFTRERCGIALWLVGAMAVLLLVRQSRILEGFGEVEEGKLCLLDADCQSEFCNYGTQKCGLKSPRGDVCVRTQDCIAGTCQQGKCVS